MDNEKPDDELERLHTLYQTVLEDMASSSGLFLSDNPIPNCFEQQIDSPLVSFILYIFSIEPSFYDEIRKMTDDPEYGSILFLGPYIFTLS